MPEDTRKRRVEAMQEMMKDKLVRSSAGPEQQQQIGVVIGSSLGTYTGKTKTVKCVECLAEQEIPYAAKTYKCEICDTIQNV